MIPLPMVIQTEDLDEACSQWLASRCDLVRCRHDEPKFRAVLAETQGMVVRSYTPVDAEMLDAAKNLRVIGRAGVGLDTIDLAECKKRSIRVVHTPGANTQAVVELVFALLLDVIRPRAFLHRPIVDLAAWKQARKQLMGRRELGSMTLGILGLGRIGSRVAEVAGAMGMNVIYHDIREIPITKRFGATPVDRDDLLISSDAISVHVDGSSSNRHIIAAPEFARLKKDIVFINASRGFVVDPFACASFMIEHPKAYAMLDVHEPEPFDATYPLLDIENVKLTPHIGGATGPASEAMSWVVRDVWRVLSGEEPEYEAKYPA